MSNLKEIDRAYLAGAIEAVREFYGEDSLCEPVTVERVRAMMGKCSDVRCPTLKDLLMSIVSFRGLMPEAGVEEISRVLAVLGWEVR